MLKHLLRVLLYLCLNQPPSGGCVLKLPMTGGSPAVGSPAAFGRLCVETEYGNSIIRMVSQPPSGGCVLKRSVGHYQYKWLTQPPSGGCVLKPFGGAACFFRLSPAAFGRLCVETIKIA